MESAAIPEVMHRDHKSCMKNVDTSCGFSAGGHPNFPKPTNRDRSVRGTLLAQDFQRSNKVRILASFTTLTKAWASSPERDSNTSISSQSEKMALISSTRSVAEREGPINCFQAGGSLRTKTRSNLLVHKFENEELTSQGEFSKLPKLPGARKGARPNIV